MADQSSLPHFEETKAGFDHIFHSSLSTSKIKDSALGGRLFRYNSNGVPGRSIAWKLFLTPEEPLKPENDVSLPSFINSWKGYRKEYAGLLLKHLRAPDGSYEDRLVIPGTGISPKQSRVSGDLEKNNPLSLDQENPWKEWFASMDLRKTILQDVERTFPDVDYFRDGEVQYQLTNILYIYSITHPAIGYRQGMHELLAPLYYAVDYDSVCEEDTHDTDIEFLEVCSRSWVAADSWRLFTSVMEGAGRWYEWREAPGTNGISVMPSHVNLNAQEAQSVQPYVAPIVQACNHIQSNLLRSVDPDLWKCLHSSGIEPQIYGIRWLRLLFTREFNLKDAMVLWDGLFACDPSFDLAQWICVAMLIRIRNKLLSSGYNEQLTYLLRYPSSPMKSEADTFASPHVATLLLQQALALQMCPTPATAASVVLENRSLLNIPSEVPEPPPRPQRRIARHGERGKSTSDVAFGADSNGSRMGHSRQQSSQQLGLHEVIARGLLDRGEALGINKTVMNAVNELKRNIPELAASLVRTPPMPSASYADFPLIDERPAEDRPPWEPRTRFEIERELSDIRSTQLKLGDSVGWIVDTLLQDEDAKVEDELKNIRDRKREALECLAYVRDVLKGGVTAVEEERLVGEEEFKKRKAKKAELLKAASESLADSYSGAPQQRLPALAVPRPAAPAAPSFNESRQRSHPIRNSKDYLASRSPPPSSPARSPTPPIHRQQPSALSPSSPLSILTPDTSATAMAPWNYTRSSFSGTPSHVATLPRPPPRISTGISNHHSVSSISRPSIPDSTQPMSPTHAERREVHRDPLGALP